MSRRIRVIALERHRGHRPRIGAEDQAAFPARSPPAVDVAGAQDPVAEHHADVTAVGPEVLVVDRHPQPRSPAGGTRNARRCTARLPTISPSSRGTSEKRRSVIGFSPIRRCAHSRPDADPSSHRRRPQRTRASAASTYAAVGRSSGTLCTSRATSAQGTGHAVSGARTMPASDSSWRSWRRRASPGAIQGSAPAGAVTRHARIGSASGHVLIIGGGNRRNSAILLANSPGIVGAAAKAMQQNIGFSGGGRSSRQCRQAPAAARARRAAGARRRVSCRVRRPTGRRD